MSLIQTEAGWKLDIRPGGRTGRRVRKTFRTKGEAQRFAAWAKTNATKTPDWEPPKDDQRKLTTLIDEWYTLHGKNLKDGANRKTKLTVLAERMDDPVAIKVTPESFSEYRSERLSEGTSPNTMNHELAYLKAVFNELKRLGKWSKENPLSTIRKLKTDDFEMGYLTTEQIDNLLEQLRQRKNSDAYKVALICLSTGARWTEAETLRAENVLQGKIRFTGTKSGKSRTIPIDDDLYSLIKMKETGRLFKACYWDFRMAVQAAEIELPPGQMTHVLRHSFASHFIMNGGNILTLQKILGHSTLVMTMRYAHLAPDHLEEAIKYKPVKTI